MTENELEKLKDKVKLNFYNDSFDYDGDEHTSLDLDGEYLISLIEAEQQRRVPSEDVQVWIPVGERLPEEYQHENEEPMEFNVMISGAKYPKTLCFNGCFWFEWCDWNKRYDVTHWMPLPPKP